MWSMGTTTERAREIRSIERAIYAAEIRGMENPPDECPNCSDYFATMTEPDSTPEELAAFAPVPLVADGRTVRCPGCSWWTYAERMGGSCEVASWIDHGGYVHACKAIEDLEMMPGLEADLLTYEFHADGESERRGHAESCGCFDEPGNQVSR